MEARPKITDTTSVATVQRWLQQENNIEQLNNGRTLLDEAASAGNESVCRFLIRKGARVQPAADNYTLFENRRNDSALTEAISGDHVSIVRFLIEAGADVNFQNEVGSTPLINVCEYGVVARAAVARAAAQGDHWRDPERVFLPTAEEVRNSYRRREKIIKMLLRAGADPTIKNQYERNALDTCMMGDFVGGQQILKPTTRVNR